MKKVLLLIIQSLFGIVLLFIFLKTNDLSKFPAYFTNLSIPTILFISFVYLLASLLRIVRFRILVKPLAKISLLDSATTSIAGSLINYLIPIRAGEVGRAWFIKKKYKLSLVSGTTVSFADKTLDFIAVLIAIVLFIPLIGNYSVFNLISYFQIGFMIFIFFGLYILVFKGKLFISVISKFFSFLPKTYSNKIISLFERAILGFSVLRLKPLAFFFLIFLSVFALVIDGVYFYLLFALLGFAVSFPLIILGYTIFNLSFIVPGGPGYIGNIEFLGVLIFSTFLGISKDYISPIIVLHHVLLTLILVGTGFLSLAILQFNFRKTYDTIFNRIK